MVALGAGTTRVIEFRVLGSLEVVDQDGPVALGAPQQRALLAVLVLHRGEAVSSDRLREATTLGRNAGERQGRRRLSSLTAT